MLLVPFRAVVLSAVSNPDAAVLLLPAEPSTVMLCLLLVPNIFKIVMFKPDADAIQGSGAEANHQP